MEDIRYKISQCERCSQLLFTEGDTPSEILSPGEQSSSNKLPAAENESSKDGGDPNAQSSDTGVSPTKLIAAMSGLSTGPSKTNRDLEQQIRELELELAQTKLALVEAECISQDLVHQLAVKEEQLAGHQQQLAAKSQNSNSGSAAAAKAMANLRQTMSERFGRIRIVANNFRDSPNQSTNTSLSRENRKELK